MGKWTRRAFLTAGVVAGGGLVVGVSLRPGNVAHDIAGTIEGEGETLVHAYVKIDADNVVTAMVPHSEMGQGAQTALAQMLAEELDADWNLVRFEEAPAIKEYGSYTAGRGYLFKGINFPDVVVPSVDGFMMKVAEGLQMQITGGSMSIRVTGQYGMRVAGAATREMLVNAAADAWGVPAAQISTENSRLYHKASNKEATYAEFAEAAASMTPSYTPKLKDASEFKIIGESKPRHDIPAKVNGTAMFAMDVKRPGMVYATVQRSPVFGGRVVSVDDKAARAIDGVIEVIQLPQASRSGMVGNFSTSGSVAVVADSYYTAQQGLKALKIEWGGEGNESVSSESIFEQFDRDITAGVDRQSDMSEGDVEMVFASAAKNLVADYTVPYLAHTCMEPLNATVEIKDGKADVWVGCQNPLGFRHAVADATGIDVEMVTLHNQLMGGGFGRKAISDCTIQAAQIAKAVGKPVQLVWSREEDVRQDFYRPAVQSRFRAALNDAGELLAWQNTYVDKHEPIEAPLIPYAVSSKDIGHVSSPTHVPFGAWRSVDHSQHGFFTESFIDEVAVAAGKDAYEYRAALLKDKPRHLAVLKKVADESNWQQPLGEGRGRGISLQESFGSIVAQVVEVTVTDGEVAVDRVVAAIDAGQAVSPDGVKAQIESGIVYGLTAALYGEITIEQGAVVQSNFHDYQAVRMSETPVIETHVINSGEDIGGAGEPGTPGIAPALTNAIYDATGTRVRGLPLNRFDLDFRIEETEAVG
ncbi:MAG: xanthine dehydrogenase family protein molybdopterin-binding subunit [Pseudomonadales bacterium]|nr:xanthine dehydrogenase family protein molybdopterin-binding subunit [Pseudomonadales bacterium]MBO7004357.1 xanthine dehydrogenase family protein molybdopterin-binding subunit [Pseudomonadales bacterium]